MPMPSLHLFLLLVLGAFAYCAAATSAPTFCKCTCFKNSTLIQLGPETSSSSPGTTTITTNEQHSLRSLHDRAASASCTQCTRAFCLSLNLPICKDAEENDALAMCFQRDSRKDQFIVWGFILGTTGLLGWAAVRRVIEMRESKKAGAATAGLSGSSAATQDRGTYIPIGRDNDR
ncbi:hypothetical protein F5X99DRAFT_411538 [Biscogniauxia marginata]|nr:hypothetical protein F5X99DRAFT_411538 [Biscogniauxia marginata]